MCSLSGAAASFRNRPLETAQRSSLRGFLSNIDCPLQLLRPANAVTHASQPNGCWLPNRRIVFFSNTKRRKMEKQQLLVWRRTGNTYTCFNPIGPSVTHQLHLKPQTHTQIELLMPSALASAGSAPTIISPSESLIYFEKTLK